MIDVTTRKPIQVETDGTEWPCIEVPVSQLDAVQQLLDRHGVRYWVHDQLLSMDEGPYEALIELGRGADAAAIQAILDSVP